MTTGRGWRIERRADGSGRWVNTDDLDRFYEEHSREMQRRREQLRELQKAAALAISQERERVLRMSFLERLAYSFAVLLGDWKRRRRSRRDSRPEDARLAQSLHDCSDRTE